MEIHVIGIIGLLLIFVVGTLRPISLGTLGIVMTFLVGSLVARESVDDMYSGFPADLFVLLAGVTYLFGLATANGTVAWIIDWATRLVRGRRALLPWVVFVVAALPTMGGALGPATVAILAPISLGLAARYDVSRKMVGLMVVHGSAAGNFSPVTPVGAIVIQTIHRNDLQMSVPTLFFANVGYNLVLGGIIFWFFGLRHGILRAAPTANEPVRFGPGARSVHEPAQSGPTDEIGTETRPLDVQKACTLLAIVAVAVCSMVLGLDIGFLAFVAAAVLHLAFPKASKGAEKHITWQVVLLICGIVTYVAALERYGTIEFLGDGIAGMSVPLLAALLLCVIASITSAVASSVGLLAVLIPLAVPFLAQGDIGITGLVVAIALAATIVDSTPFSTVGALVVANTVEEERDMVYRGLLRWGLTMVATAPIVAWLLFVLPASG